MGTTHETDYLIVGTGAVGMAFADILLTETDANFILVDEYAKPGGHWNAAYPFVTLHQPSAYYGVSSKELSKGSKDQVGLNKGLNDLASGAEVSAYFDEVMRQQFLPSGRVQYFPMCSYIGDGKFVSKVSGETHTVTYKKLVDATHLKTEVPSTHTPNFTIDNSVRFIPLNDLTRQAEPPEGYTVIGGGKTGIDACLWLLENGTDPDKIRWIMPRDAWLLDRENTQPTLEFFNSTMGAQAGQMEAIANASSITDMFNRLEACGYFLRIDTNVRPSMFHGATVSKLELAELRRIKNIIRMGRVTDIGIDTITLENGTIPTSPSELHVDCTASAITNVEMKPIFQGNVITPQMVRSYQPVFSAAFIAHVEVAYDTEKKKNELCGLVPVPNHDTDYLYFTAAFMRNQFVWSQDTGLKDWLLNNRLDGFSKMVSEVDPNDTEKMDILNRFRANAMPAMGMLQNFIAQLESKEQANG
ncbi:hypothetical protein [Kordiimonas laminariae]|uniref:hypothetical protein n=1 Tax=Kordiimonas laminariae TaxID=2917717 RepID=UPI001FF31490|nr:hypothetical protein [Kordiimonas laminariae]MCK0070715.1 hypothetical protein [Kordiimonas laminariae]